MNFVKLKFGAQLLRKYPNYSQKRIGQIKQMLEFVKTVNYVKGYPQSTYSSSVFTHSKTSNSQTG